MGMSCRLSSSFFQKRYFDARLADEDLRRFAQARDDVSGVRGRFYVARDEDQHDEQYGNGRNDPYDHSKNLLFWCIG